MNGGSPPYTYSWTASAGGVIPLGQENNEDLTNLISGQYSVIITDGNNCVYEAGIIQELYISEPPPFDIELIHTYQPLCYDELGWVDFSVSGATPGEAPDPMYYYNVKGELHPTYEGPDPISLDEEIINYTPGDTIFLTPGAYDFYFIDANNCESETFNVEIDQQYEDCLLIPTLFSPNGDLVNDVWEIGGIQNYPDAQITVYNRWGQVVFESNNNYFGNEWDGTYKGTPLPFAVYYFTIDPLHEYGKTYHGGVTIKR